MAAQTLTVHSSLLFDPKKKAFLPNISLTIDLPTGSIVDIYTRSSSDIPDTSLPITTSSPSASSTLDLRHLVLLPGLVDAHTHIFLHPYTEASSLTQMRDESVIERTVRATNHVHSALMSGYTTYRDLGTEAMENYDANFRDCVNRELLRGGSPRLFVATHAIVSSGSYEVRGENLRRMVGVNGGGGGRVGQGLGMGVTMPQAGDVADGVDGVRAAVRRRVADGADVIKLYADYRRRIMRFPPTMGRKGTELRFPPSERELNPAKVMWTQDEMDAIVDEAKAAGLPVAAHAGSHLGAMMAVRAGVTSLEHGSAVMDEDKVDVEELCRGMIKHGTIFVPTLAVFDAAGIRQEKMALLQAQVKTAYKMGVRLAAGGDTGAFAHGEGVRELELMIKSGMSVEDALEACTVGGWEACGGDGCGYRFGWFEKGARADIIGLLTDPRTDDKALKKVEFVMKDGEVWKKDGKPVDVVREHRWEDIGEADNSSNGSLVLGTDWELAERPV